MTLQSSLRESDPCWKTPIPDHKLREIMVSSLEKGLCRLEKRLYFNICHAYRLRCVGVEQSFGGSKTYSMRDDLICSNGCSIVVSSSFKISMRCVGDTLQTAVECESACLDVFSPELTEFEFSKKRSRRLKLSSHQLPYQRLAGFSRCWLNHIPTPSTLKRSLSSPDVVLGSRNECSGIASMPVNIESIQFDPQFFLGLLCGALKASLDQHLEVLFYFAIINIQWQKKPRR